MPEPTTIASKSVLVVIVSSSSVGPLASHLVEIDVAVIPARHGVVAQFLGRSDLRGVVAEYGKQLEFEEERGMLVGSVANLVAHELLGASALIGMRQCACLLLCIAGGEPPAPRVFAERVEASEA